MTDSCIIVLEDDSPTLKRILRALLAEFPQCAVLGAPDASAAIQIVLNPPAPPFAAILDLMVPKEPGESPDRDRSVCSEMRRRYPRAVVLHVTAFPDDPTLRDHLDDVHDPAGQGQVLFDKNDTHCPDAVIARLHAIYHGRRIREQIEALAPAADSGSGRRGAPREAASGSLTNRLDELKHDIIDSWKHLDDKTRQLVRENFYITEHGGETITVSLLPPEEPNQ